MDHRAAAKGKSEKMLSDKRRRGKARKIMAPKLLFNHLASYFQVPRQHWNDYWSKHAGSCALADVKIHSVFEVNRTCGNLFLGL